MTIVTESVYNLVLASGRAKEISSILGINYATLMRELNIYDAQAKLGVKTFLQIIHMLQDQTTLVLIADKFELMLQNNNSATFSSPSLDSSLNTIFTNLSNKIKEYPERQQLAKDAKKSYVRLLKEVNVYDPSAKLGIDTFVRVTYILQDVESIVALMNLAGYVVMAKQHELSS